MNPHFGLTNPSTTLSRYLKMPFEGTSRHFVVINLPTKLSRSLRRMPGFESFWPSCRTSSVETSLTQGDIASRRPWAYCRNSLVSSPMPSIATVTVLTGSFMTPMPTDVPQAIKSPGNRVMSCEILLTSCCALKIMSDIG